MEMCRGKSSEFSESEFDCSRYWGALSFTCPSLLKREAELFYLLKENEWRCGRGSDDFGVHSDVVVAAIWTVVVAMSLATELHFHYTEKILYITCVSRAVCATILQAPVSDHEYRATLVEIASMTDLASTMINEDASPGCVGQWVAQKMLKSNMEATHYLTELRKLSRP